MTSPLHPYANLWVEAFKQAHQAIRPHLAFRQAPWTLEVSLREAVSRYLSQSDVASKISPQEWAEHLTQNPPQVEKWIKTQVFIHPNWQKPMNGASLLDQPLYQKQILGHTTLGQADQVYDKQQQINKDIRDLTLDIDSYIALQLREDLKKALADLKVDQPALTSTASSLASSLKAHRLNHSPRESSVVSSAPASSPSPSSVAPNGVSEFLRKKP